MDGNGHAKLDRDTLHKEIKKELSKHFKSFDNDMLSYITGKIWLKKNGDKLCLFDINPIDVIDSNQDDFSTTEDIQEAIGAVLSELTTDGQSDDVIEELCSSFLKILTG